MSPGADRQPGGRRDGFPVLLTVAAGTAGSIALGVAFGPFFPRFGIEVLDPARPASQCISVGFIASSCLALFRAGWPRGSVLLAAMIPLFYAAIAAPRGVAAALLNAAAGSVLAGTIVCMAVVFDALAAAGYRFGKFLLTGPLLGGAYFAVTPLTGLTEPRFGRIATSIMFNALLGFAIGDGVAFGIEAAEAASRALERRRPGPPPDAPVPPPPPPVVE